MKDKKNKKMSLLSGELKKQSLNCILYMLLGIGDAVCGFFSVVELANAIGQITLGDSAGAIHLFIVALILLITKELCFYLNVVVYHNTAINIMKSLNQKVIAQALKLNALTYASHDTGLFVDRIIQGPQNLVGQLDLFIYNIIIFLSKISVLIYVASLNIWVSLALIGTITLCEIIEYFGNKFYKKNSKKVNRLSEQNTSITTQIIKSEQDVKSLNLDIELQNIANKSFTDFRKMRRRTNLEKQTFNVAREIIWDIGSILTLILGVHLMDIALISMATFMIVYSNQDSIASLISIVSSIWNNAVDIKVNYQRLNKVFDEDEFVTEKFGDKTLENPQGNIEFKNVSFSYIEKKNGEDDILSNTKEENNGEIKKTTIFENLNFTIPAKTTVAFVGRSGSGKSTILNLISKMYEVDGGEVLIDGMNINELTKDSLRQTISLVNQFPYLFDMTIKENLLLVKKDASDEEIIDALKSASFYDFVSKLPDGINTRVGEGGMKLSGGQRQRLAIARALLRKSQILIFDESTSALDNYAQNDIKKSINGLKGKNTVIIVAHRLSTIRDAEKIYYLDEGKILANGSFEDLFNNNEKFRTMYLAENLDN